MDLSEECINLFGHSRVTFEEYQCQDEEYNTRRLLFEVYDCRENNTALVRHNDTIIEEWRIFEQYVFV